VASVLRVSLSEPRSTERTQAGPPETVPTTSCVEPPPSRAGAGPGAPAFLRRPEDLCRGARGFAQDRSQLVAVVRLASRRSHEHVDALTAELACAANLCAGDCGCLDELLLAEGAATLDLLTESELYSVLAQRDEAAVFSSSHEQPERVRSHVDDPDRHCGDSDHPAGRHPLRVQ
jgi:hypothetical protein